MADIANLQFRADTGDIKNANTVLDQLAQSAVKTEKAADKLGDAVARVGKGAGTGLKVTKQDLNALLDSLNPTSKAFDNLDKAMRQLQSARNQKLINTDQFSDFSAIVEQQRIALQKQFDNLTGYTAAQKKAATEAAAAARQAAQEEAAAVKQAAAEATAARREAAIEATAIYRKQQLEQREAIAAETLAQRAAIAEAATTQRKTIADNALAQRKAAAEAAQAYREQQAASAALAAQERKTQQENKRITADIDRLRGVLDPATAATKKLQEQFSLLDRASAAGQIRSTEYVQLRQQLVQLNAVVKESALSAGQLRQGWTTAGYQLKDIFTSLASGINPLTVAAQQLPTLALSFGSLGATLTAFSVLINPITVGIAALVAGVGYLGYEAYQTSTQMDTLQKSLNGSGNIAGTTARQLRDMATALAETTKTTQSTAVDAVAAASAIGRTTDQIKQFAEAALVVSKSTGEGVKEVLGQFKQLAGDPVQALATLNEQYNFANQALYDHVKALSESGDKTQAMTLIVDALEKSTKRMAETTENSISNSTSFWDSLANSISRAYNNASNYQDTFGKAAAGAKTGSAVFDTINEDQQKTAKDTENRWKNIAAAAQDAATVINDATARQKQFNREQIEANAKTDAFLKTARTNEQVRADYTKEWKRQLDAGLITQQKYNQLVAAVASKYKDPKTPKTPAVKVDQGDKLTEQYQAQNLALDAQIELLKNRSAYEANASAQRKSYLELEAKYTVLEQAASERKLTKQEQQMLAVKDETLSQAKILADKGDQLAAMQRQAQVQDEISKLQATQTAQAKVYADNQGVSTKELQRQIDLAQTRASVLAKGGTADQANVAAQIKEIDFKQADARAADWIGGMKTGLADWADSASNYAKIAADAMSTAMNTASNAVSNFVITGKLDFADFTKSILKMIVDIISQLLVMNALKAGANAIGFGGLFANAKGGVYDDPSLSKYSNGVFSSPQFFSFGGRSQFAKGGVFAEAGPEAIMPLTRDSNGRLGVKAEGAGGGGSIGINQNITVNANGSATSNTSTSGDAMGRALGDQMNAAAMEVLRSAIRPGGVLYRWQKGG